MAENEQMTFDYVDLNQIDPSFTVLPKDMYTLSILKAEKLSYDKKVNGVPTGEQGQYIKFNLAVTDHPTYSGRRLFPTLFPSNYTFRILRRLADRTGVQQEPNTPIDAWLARLSEIQPKFKVLVGYATKRIQKQNPETGELEWTSEVIVNEQTGKPQDNALDWRELQPAD